MKQSSVLLVQGEIKRKKQTLMPQEVYNKFADANFQCLVMFYV